MGNVRSTVSGVARRRLWAAAAILGADVYLTFYDLNGDQPQVRSDAHAQFLGAELFFIDEASGNEKRIVGETGVYVAPVTFDQPGEWGVRVDVTIGDRRLDPLPFRFNVLEKSPEPAIGDSAFPSRQRILDDVKEISQIDSSFPPRPHMHSITVADALKKEKPIVLAFATPAFCESRTCGPVMETVMDPLYNKYKGRAIFIHIEPYKLKELREGIGRIPVKATNEWKLESEPWIFVIDSQGKIAGKFEGIIGLKEVEQVLRDALKG
ncbi:MAG: hypothetical protein HYS09_09625 [Chloroflexi bacterium]|nr:hypothetical protein [Chloroflexota bacterium]